jgi:hypothetical protein
LAPSRNREANPRVLDDSAFVSCPYCGETIEVLLDSGGGASQEYVEDCEVCCRPWLVRVELGRGGGARVEVERLE